MPTNGGTPAAADPQRMASFTNRDPRASFSGPARPTPPSPQRPAPQAPGPAQPVLQRLPSGNLSTWHDDEDKTQSVHTRSIRPAHTAHNHGPEDLAHHLAPTRYAVRPSARKIGIIKGELEKMKSIILSSPNCEIGGDLFGGRHNDQMKVYYVLGPGPASRGTVTAFFQDARFLEEKGNLLAKLRIEHIGEWHSHHQLNLPRPSGGDIETVTSALKDYNREGFLLCIGVIQKYRESRTSPVVLRPEAYPFWFKIDEYGWPQIEQCDWEILDLPNHHIEQQLQMAANPGPARAAIEPAYSPLVPDIVRGLRQALCGLHGSLLDPKHDGKNVQFAIQLEGADIQIQVPMSWPTQPLTVTTLASFKTSMRPGQALDTARSITVPAQPDEPVRVIVERIIDAVTTQLPPGGKERHAQHRGVCAYPISTVIDKKGQLRAVEITQTQGDKWTIVPMHASPFFAKTVKKGDLRWLRPDELPVADPLHWQNSENGEKFLSKLQGYLKKQNCPSKASTIIDQKRPYVVVLHILREDCLAVVEFESATFPAGKASFRKFNYRTSSQEMDPSPVNFEYFPENQDVAADAFAEIVISKCNPIQL